MYTGLPILFGEFWHEKLGFPPGRNVMLWHYTPNVTMEGKEVGGVTFH